MRLVVPSPFIIGEYEPVVSHKLRESPLIQENGLEYITRAEVFKSKFTDKVPFKDISYIEDQCRPEYYEAPCYWGDKVVDENVDVSEIPVGTMD